MAARMFQVEDEAMYKRIKTILLQDGQLIDYVNRHTKVGETALIAAREAFGSLVIEIRTMADFKEQSLQDEPKRGNPTVYWYKVRKAEAHRDMRLTAIEDPALHGVTVPKTYQQVIIRHCLVEVVA
jgi:hypothetical protein